MCFRDGKEPVELSVRAGKCQSAGSSVGLRYSTIVPEPATRDLVLALTP